MAAVVRFGGAGAQRLYGELVTEAASVRPELHPLALEHLTLETFAEIGLLFRWSGRRSDDDPVVLTAH